MLINKAGFEKTMENVRKHRDIKLVITVRRRNYLVSEPICYTTKFSCEHFFAIEMIKIQILMNKPIYLGLSTLELSKIVMREFWYNYVKPKYCEKAKLGYMDKASFIVYIKTDDVYKYIAEDVETKFENSDYELGRPLSKKNKVITLMKDKLGEKIINDVLGLRAKIYSYLLDDGREDTKAKCTKKYVIR